MKSLTEHLWFEVPNRRGFVNITDTVEDLVRRSGVQEGLCLVNAMQIASLPFLHPLNASADLPAYTSIASRCPAKKLSHRSASRLLPSP
jgi:hypothetical protein